MNETTVFFEQPRAARCRALMKPLRLGAALVILATPSIFSAAEENPASRALPEILTGVKKILFYGDSLTDGSDYPDYVVNTLQREFPGVKFERMNSAIVGNTAADLRVRLQADVLDRKPDLVLICIGTNDRIGNRPIADFSADLESMVGDLIHAGIRVMLVRPSPFGNPKREAAFQDNLAVIQEVAARHHLPVADAHQVFLDGAEAGREMLGTDGIHHGKDGFAGMARAVINAFGLKDVPLDTSVHPWPYLLLDWETSLPVSRKPPYEPGSATGWKAFDRKAAVEQQPWAEAPFAARGAWMPFAPGKAPAGMAAYGRTRYHATSAGKAELRLGGSPPMVVWLNGRQVYATTKARGYHPDADRLKVDIQAGDNELIVLSHYMAFVGIRPSEKRP